MKYTTNALALAHWLWPRRFSVHEQKASEVRPVCKECWSLGPELLVHEIALSLVVQEPHIIFPSVLCRGCFLICTECSFRFVLVSFDLLYNKQQPLRNNKNPQVFSPFGALCSWRGSTKTASCRVLFHVHLLQIALGHEIIW